MKEKTPNNPRGAGRSESGKKTYPVRCHHKVISDIRRIAKEKSEEQFKKDLDDKPRNS